MKNLNLIKHPECFHGEKFINNNSTYFEGWYFKISNGNDVISFIPGISIENGDFSAFIQIITKYNSYFLSYSFQEFSYSHSPFYIKIGNNKFSLDEININIKDSFHNLNISGNIHFSNSTPIKSNLYSPNIMGPFSYLPFMECNHAILSMKSNTSGLINFNNNLIDFNSGTAYIEKDWGTSFPKSYIWSQSNEFINFPANFMLSIAKIPFGLFNFTGIICDISFKNKEYKFATYYGAKLLKFDVNNEFIFIEIQQGNKILSVSALSENSNFLLAPSKGKMKKEILESISSKIDIQIKEKDKIIFSNTGLNSGLEIVI